MSLKKATQPLPPLPAAILMVHLSTKAEEEKSSGNGSRCVDLEEGGGGA
jgi:hypothetical protein